MIWCKNFLSERFSLRPKTPVEKHGQVSKWGFLRAQRVFWAGFGCKRKVNEFCAFSSWFCVEIQFCKISIAFWSIAKNQYPYTKSMRGRTIVIWIKLFTFFGRETENIDIPADFVYEFLTRNFWSEFFSLFQNLPFQYFEDFVSQKKITFYFFFCISPPGLASLWDF